MMNEKVFVPLFDFQTLFDTDFGIVSLIGAEYRNSGIFRTEWFQQHNSNRVLVKSLYERVDRNPLVQLSAEGIDRKEIDELYQSFFEDKDIYKKVLERSMRTELFRLFYTFSKNGDIYPYILYQNDIELEFLEKVFKDEYISSSTFIPINDFIMKPEKYKYILQFYSKYAESMYMSAVSSFLNIRDGVYRTVYIIDYNFNCDKLETGERAISATKDVLSILMNNHSVRSIDLYNRIKLEEG